MLTFKIRHLLVIVFLAFILASNCCAARAEDSSPQEQPLQYPSLFYGTVRTEAGQPVPFGTVRAYVYGELCGQLSFCGGQYGQPADDPFVKRLLVYSSQDISGKEISFKVYAVGMEYQAVTVPAEVLFQPRTKQKVDLVVPLSGTGKNILDVFSDLEGHWAGQTVRELAYKGLLGGYEDGTFRPDNVINRIEGAAMLERALKLPSVNEENASSFDDNGDIPAWARGTVASIVAAGLMSGYQESNDAKTFRPLETLNRYELAVILSRLEFTGAGSSANEPVDFKDWDEVPIWARQAVNIAVQQGMVKGYPDGTFKPQKEVTRAEAAAMIARLGVLIEHN